jgi:hypothetical protein
MKPFASGDSSRKFASSDRLGSSECMYLPSKVLFKQSQAVAALRAIRSNPAATSFARIAACWRGAWPPRSGKPCIPTFSTGTDRADESDVRLVAKLLRGYRRMHGTGKNDFRFETAVASPSSPRFGVATSSDSRRRKNLRNKRKQFFCQSTTRVLMAARPRFRSSSRFTITTPTFGSA